MENVNFRWNDRWNPNRGDSRGPDIDRLLGVGLVVALALFLASFLPPPLVAVTVKELLFYGAVGAAIHGTVRREGLSEDRVTAWDQTAMLLLGSLLSGLLVDPEAAAEALADITAHSRGIGS